MKAIYKIGFAGIFLVVILTGIFWLKPDSPLEKGMIIATSVPHDVNILKGDFGTDNRYLPGTSIIALKMNDDKKDEPVLLTGDFYSARSPEVSYAGDLLVFSAQKSEGDLWQIYILDLQSFKVRQVTHCPVNCTDPTWLPDGRIAFSRLNDEEPTGPIHVLYACEPDGSNMTRLMYHPNSAIASSVFQDGRILTLSEQKYPEVGKRHMLALRIDGTKSELFYGSNQNAGPVSRAWEAPDGQVYFIEKRMGETDRGNLVSVVKGHPMSSYIELSNDIKGDFHSVYPDVSGNMLVSYKETDDQPFGLHTFDINYKKIKRKIYTPNDFHIIEPVVLEERKLPMQLPANVDESKENGTLLCLNVDLSMYPVADSSRGIRSTDKVQVFGLNEILGEVPVEKDGSFYIEIDADTPVRFQTVDANGEILRGPSAWIWVRPNEKRSCIGCHENPELAPDNRVPDALYAGMVRLPEGEKTEAIMLTGKHRQNEE